MFGLIWPPEVPSNLNFPVIWYGNQMSYISLRAYLKSWTEDFKIKVNETWACQISMVSPTVSPLMWDNVYVFRSVLHWYNHADTPFCVEMCSIFYSENCAVGIKAVFKFIYPSLSMAISLSLLAFYLIVCDMWPCTAVETENAALYHVQLLPHLTLLL